MHFLHQPDWQVHADRHTERRTDKSSNDVVSVVCGAVFLGEYHFYSYSYESVRKCMWCGGVFYDEMCVLGWEAILRTSDGQPEYVNVPPPRPSSTTEQQNKQHPEQEQDHDHDQEKKRSIADIMRAAYESNNVAPLVVYTGDAAGVLDPLLAQGAGLAVETGFHLAQTIQEAREMHASDAALRGGTALGVWDGEEGRSSGVDGDRCTVMNIDNMKLHLLDFESARSRRFRKLHVLGGVSHAISNLETEV